VRRWHLFRRNAVVDFDRGKITRRGLRNAWGWRCRLDGGAWMHEMQPALGGGDGGAEVGFADSTEPYLPRCGDAGGVACLYRWRWWIRVALGGDRWASADLGGGVLGHSGGDAGEPGDRQWGTWG